MRAQDFEQLIASVPELDIDDIRAQARRAFALLESELGEYARNPT